VPRDLLTASTVEELGRAPTRGRTFTSRRRVRLSDMDRRGRVRLDAIARYLQDAAIEDVEETGWGLPDHLWFIRHIRLDVTVPFLEDRDVDLVTWSSGRGTVAAGRRWSVTGDRGGRIEVESVWIHLGPDERPARLDDFGVYAESAGDRLVTTKLELPDPPPDAPRVSWPLRVTDIDLHGHLNNAAYWHAVEERLAQRTTAGGPDPMKPLRALLDYRHPIDVGDDVQIMEWPVGDAAVHLAFVTADVVKAVARFGPLAT
jgi:acyl-ACP thioesterase